MGKKGKKGGGKQFALRDVRMTARQKKYKNAYRQLVNAKIKVGQEQEAEDMKALLILGQASDFFAANQYQDCLTYLNNNEHQVSDHPLFSQRVPWLRGLCSFHLADFETSKKIFSTASENIDTLPYHFYYLLSLIYEKQEEIDFSDLPHSAKLPKIQQDFLKVTIELQSENYQGAFRKLEKISLSNDSEKANQRALLNILKKDTKTDLTPIVKPLYRAMSAAGLSEEEAQYLNQFPVLTQQYHLSTKAIPQQEIRDLLKKLCERGELLSPSELELCLRSPEELHPSILYNQAAVLVNEDKPENKSKLQKLIKTHYRQLCRIPEFIYIYSWALAALNIEFRSNTVRNTLLTYGSYFADKLTAQKTEEISIQLLYAADNAANVSFGYLEDLYKSLLNIAPNLRIIRFNLFKLYADSPPGKYPIDWSLLNVFGEKNSPEVREFMIDGAIELASSVFRSLDHIDRSLYMVPPDLVERVLTSICTNFDHLLEKNPPLITDNTPLELLCVMGDIFLLEKGRGHNLGGAFTSFLSTLTAYIEYFKEPVASEYRAYLKGYQNGNPRDDIRQDKADIIQTKFEKIFVDLKSKKSSERREGLQSFSEMNLTLVKSNNFQGSSGEAVGEFFTTIRVFTYGNDLKESEVVECVSDFGEKFMNLVKPKQEEDAVDVIFDVIESQLGYAANQTNVSVVEAFLISCRSLVLDEKNLGVSAREVLQEYLGDILDAKTRGENIKIDKQFHKELVDLLLKIENKTRRRKFKALLKDFQNRIL